MTTSEDQAAVSLEEAEDKEGTENTAEAADQPEADDQQPTPPEQPVQPSPQQEPDTKQILQEKISSSFNLCVKACVNSRPFQN